MEENGYFKKLQVKSSCFVDQWVQQKIEPALCMTSSVALDSNIRHFITFLCFRSFLVEQDWTQTSKREGTFVLDQPQTPESSSSTPASIRSSTALIRPVQDSNSRSASSRSRIPSACQRKIINTDQTNANGNGFPASEDLLAAISQVEETISPLARANCQIRDSLATLEKNLIVLKTASASCAEMSI